MTEGLALAEMARALRAALVEFDPALYSGEDCAVLVEELATTEKVCVAARLRAAIRAGACGAHRERGFADVSDWLGRATGSSSASAKAALDAVAALDGQREVKAALEAGELSIAQADELVKTEGICPGSAGELLEVAGRHSLKVLKELAREHRAPAVGREELHRLQHEARHFRHWRTRLGPVAAAFELPPEVGLPIVNRLEAETDRLWRQARRHAKAAGGQPRRSALAADAFAAWWKRAGKGKRGRPIWSSSATWRRTAGAIRSRARHATSWVADPFRCRWPVHWGKTRS